VQTQRKIRKSLMRKIQMLMLRKLKRKKVEQYLHWHI